MRNDGSTWARPADHGFQVIDGIGLDKRSTKIHPIRTR
jgi:hypothetical protein